MEKLKRCACCDEDKPISMFANKKAAKDGKSSYCKKCMVIKATEYNECNKEKIKVHQKKFYLTNKEKIKECHKKYYQKNKEKIIQHQIEYYQLNREKLRKYQTEYYYRNKTQI